MNALFFFVKAQSFLRVLRFCFFQHSPMFFLPYMEIQVFECDSKIYNLKKTLFEIVYFSKLNFYFFIPQGRLSRNGIHSDGISSNSNHHCKHNWNVDDYVMQNQ